jgi:hypothetical protein
MSLPIMIVLCLPVPNIYKYKFITYGNQMIKILCICGLSYLFINKGSFYNKINYKSQSLLDNKIDWNFLLYKTTLLIF